MTHISKPKMSTTVTSISSQKIFDALYQQFQKEVSLMNCGVGYIMHFIVLAMQNVEKFAKANAKQYVIHGLQKKEMVKELVMKYFAEYGDWDANKKNQWEQLQLPLRRFMDNVIDVIVSAAKGQMQFAQQLSTQPTIKQKKRCAKKAPNVLANNIRRDVVTDENTLVTQIYQQVYAAIANQQFDCSNIMLLVTTVMQAVSNLSQLTAAQKKDVAMTVITQLVAAIPMPTDEKSAKDAINNTTISQAIDYIIAAANGQLNIGQIVTEIQGLFASCAGCCAKK